ncbi:proline--tRNA ligase [Leptospirillum ferrooxidans]|uniref:Proline--tRNA ligase n=1 Tax=Leptospirillum ferrooxidans (strain C2-3) TaxID=1162668 RepID=I0IQS0_LEPFC|nr:proline--tRNA ligase [Leptospirillum ferrooxidans]BAM07619.1 putative prolyl-tRNA synthetase [Leptospirillum ferrooxidans C2-3]
MRSLSDPFLTLHEDPSDAEVASHKLMLRAGFIHKLAGGIYTYLPSAVRVLRKIESIVRKEMNRAGGLEILMPSLQPADLWESTGRWEKYGKELFRLSDRHERSFALGPTHEEVVTSLIGGLVGSYRQLPVLVYQIQTKFRDEIRPRFGLLRGREFIMKDAYSFSTSEEDAKAIYQKMQEAYKEIFRKLGLRARMVEADSGLIGGNLSHEFMIMAPSGEDTVISCSSCDWAANIEKAEGITTCPVCQADVSRVTAIEVGHVFYLGHKYSLPMNGLFSDQDGQEKPFVMGCYGIGMSRLLACAIEQSHDEKGIIWPVSMAPFQISVLPLGPVASENPSVISMIEDLESRFPDEVYIDDRDLRAGVKFGDADLKGFPVQVICGEKNLAAGKVEIKVRKTGEREILGFADVPTRISEILKTLAG